MDIEQVATFNHADGCRSVCATVAGERVIAVSSRRRPPAANVLLIHGLGDYPARHLQNARWLAGRGYRTVMVELAGHGGHADDWARTMPFYDAYAATERASEVLQRFRTDARLVGADRSALIARQYERLERTLAAEHMAQIRTVLRHFAQVVGDPYGLPLFLVGHSMGGLLAHETVSGMAARERAALAGVVLLAPALRPQGNPDSPLMQLAVNGVWRLRRAAASPTRTAVKALLDLNFGVDTEWGNKWLSDVPAEVELFATDPLLPHRLPTRYASSIESLMAASSSRGAPVAYDGLVMVPRRDGITSREAAVTFAQRTNGAGRTRLALFDLDVVAHDILRSSARERALAVMGDWMDGRLRTAAPPEQRYAS